MKVTIHKTGMEKVALKYVVIAAKHDGEWILARHRDRKTWEFAGGHIEWDESPEEAAARELYEETGAEEFTLSPICIYSVIQDGVPESFGKLFYAEVDAFGPLPGYEMEEIMHFKELPTEVTYPMIYPALTAKLKEWLEQGEPAL